MEKYNCECCHYSTNKLSNYKKHLSSKKHKEVEKITNNLETKSQQKSTILEAESTISQHFYNLSFFSIFYVYDTQKKKLYLLLESCHLFFVYYVSLNCELI